jgi:putative ABC transport system ATP-binding protein
MLEISHISKTFNPGTVNAKLALEDLSLEVKDGDFITIIGANGAGKSTLFNAIAGGFYVDEGNILLDGEDITYTPEHVRARSIGRLYQDPMRGTAPAMSIEENLTLAAGKGGWLSRIDNDQREAFREILGKLDMGLEDRLKQPMGLLSGGQRQAVTLLMATINPPKLLLLDEHTAALDPAAADKILSITQDTVEKEHLTCLMITHNMQSALELGNRTLMMDGGRIILDISGERRKNMTVQDLMDSFREISGRALDNDRMMLLGENRK